MSDPMPVPSVILLADAQLRAYNRRDTEAFCACFSDDVRVIDERGEVTVSGMEAFRERYQGLFEGWCEVGGHITGRLCLPPHVVEAETWCRRKTADADLESGQVIVRYTEKDGRLALVEFLRPSMT